MVETIHGRSRWKRRKYTICTLMHCAHPEQGLGVRSITSLFLMGQCVHVITNSALINSIASVRRLCFSTVLAVRVSLVLRCYCFRRLFTTIMFDVQ